MSSLTTLEEDEEHFDSKLVTGDEKQFASKLTTAVQRMLDGHLKENHDDTLFEKLCHFIEHEVPTARLKKIDLFELIEQNLPEVFEESLKDQARLAMCLRLASAVASHEVLVEKYFKEHSPGRITSHIFKIIDEIKIMRTLEKLQKSTISMMETKITIKVIYSLCHLLESISSTFQGCFCFFTRIMNYDVPEKNNKSILAFIFELLTSSTISNYLREKIIRLAANLLQFRRFVDRHNPDLNIINSFFEFEAIRSFEEFFNEVRTTKDTPLLSNMSNLLQEIKILKIDFPKEYEPEQKLDLVVWLCDYVPIISLINELTMSLEPDDNISELVARVAWAYHDAEGEPKHEREIMEPIINMIQTYIPHFYDTQISFRLLTFLIDTYGMRYEVGDGTVGQRGFTMKYMHRMISIVGEHNDFVVLESMWNELPSRDKRLIVDTTAYMSYNDFEFHTFRMLNRLGDTGKLSHLFQFDLLTCGLLKALTKLSNEKHLRMLYRFIEGIAQRNRDHECIIGELMFSFTQVLTEQRHRPNNPPPMHVILKIIRVLYPRLGELYTRSFFMHYLTGMLHVCNTRFRRVDMLDDESHELIEMLLESIHQLYLHLDFRAFVNHGQGDNAIEQLIEASNRTIRHLMSFLESESFQSSHPIMVTTLHAIEMKAKQENVKCLNGDLCKFDWKKVLKDFDHYELTARQTFVLNQKALLEMNPAMRLVDLEEMRFYCHHLVDETDCELQMELIDIVSLLVNYRFDIVDTNQELFEWCAQTGVLQLGHDLLAPPITLPRIAALAAKFNENLQEQLLGRSSEEEIRKSVSDKVEPAILEAFFRKLPDKKDMEVDKSSDKYPHLHLLDDIICAISVDDEMVMDCY